MFRERIFHASRSVGKLCALLVAFAVCLQGGGYAQAQTQIITIPVGNSQGSLTYTYSAQRACVYGTEYAWYGFTYVAPGGTSTSLGAGRIT